MRREGSVRGGGGEAVPPLPGTAPGPNPGPPAAPAPVSAAGSPADGAACGTVPSWRREKEEEENRPLSEVSVAVLPPRCRSQRGSECRGYKGLLLPHAGSLKSKSYSAVSKATTCGIIKKDGVLLCQI